MSTQIVLYNKTVKDKFLSKQVNDNTRLAYHRIFKFSQPFEEQLQKDVGEFNALEFIQVLQSLNASTKMSVGTYARILRLYVEFAIKEGIRKNGTNPLKTKDVKSWLGQRIQTPDDIYLSEDQIMNSVGLVRNPQISVIVLLLWNGVMGIEHAELRNLKQSDVNFSKNELTLYDHFTDHTRSILVDQFTLDMIDQALKQRESEKINGGVTRLVQNEFVIRNNITRIKYTGQVSWHTIFRRIVTVEEKLGLKNLRPTTIYRSGMIRMAKEIHDKNGFIDSNHIHEIANRYNQGYYYMGYIKDWINIENLNRLYPSDKPYDLRF